MARFDSLGQGVKEFLENLFIEVLPHGSGIDGDWTIDYRPNSGVIGLRNGYHCMDENGMYDDWAEFTLWIRLHEPDFFRLMFHGKRGQDLAMKYMLREYLEELFTHTLDVEALKPEPWRKAMEDTLAYYEEEEDD